MDGITWLVWFKLKAFLLSFFEISLTIKKNKSEFFKVHNLDKRCSKNHWKVNLNLNLKNIVFYKMPKITWLTQRIKNMGANTYYFYYLDIFLKQTEILWNKSKFDQNFWKTNLQSNPFTVTLDISWRSEKIRRTCFSFAGTSSFFIALVIHSVYKIMIIFFKYKNLTLDLLTTRI